MKVRMIMILIWLFYSHITIISSQDHLFGTSRDSYVEQGRLF